MFIHVIIHYSYVPAPVTRSQLFITLWLYFSLALVFTGSRVEKEIQDMLETDWIELTCVFDSVCQKEQPGVAKRQLQPMFSGF